MVRRWVWVARGLKPWAEGDLRVATKPACAGWVSRMAAFAPLGGVLLDVGSFREVGVRW